MHQMVLCFKSPYINRFVWVSSFGIYAVFLLILYTIVKTCVCVCTREDAIDLCWMKNGIWVWQVPHCSSLNKTVSYISSLRHHANAINTCLTADSECVCHWFVGYMVISQKAERGVLADLDCVIESLLIELGKICWHTQANTLTQTNVHTRR